MKHPIISVIIVVILVFAGIARADIVELDLFTLGCPSEYDYNTPSWSADFDLDTIFSQIDHVYMDWAGQITGGMAINYDDPDNPFPIDVGIGSYLESPPNWRHVSLWGGESTYPNPDTFNYQLEFIYGGMPWSELYDGQSRITIDYKELIMLNGGYIEHGSVALTKAILVVEGAAVPEPATIMLLGLGCLFMKSQNQIEGIEQ